MSRYRRYRFREMVSFLSLAVTPSSDVKVNMSGIREVLVNHVSSLLLNIKKKKQGS